MAKIKKLKKFLRRYEKNKRAEILQPADYFCLMMNLNALLGTLNRLYRFSPL